MTLFACKFSRTRKIILLVAFFAAEFPYMAGARIQDTKKTAEARYGQRILLPMKTTDGIEYIKYKAGGFVITQYYLEGYCERATYVKIYVPGMESELLVDELKKILVAEKRFGKWELQNKAIGNGLFKIGTTKIKHTNGTVLEIKTGNKIVELTTPRFYSYKEAVLRKKEADRKENLGEF